MIDLHTAGHRRGVVCAPHAAAAEAGQAILGEGGNALEAMVAMAASIAAVYPHMNHLGGDGFWLVREPNRRVRAIMAAGPAGSLATPALYRQHEAIPSRGPLAALTVPGAVGGWMLAIEAARAVGGKGLPLDLLLHAAIGQARDGYVVAKSQARLTTEKLAELKGVPGFAETFLPDGKPPEAGTKLKQSALFFTLDRIAHAGLDDFYRGDVGREIAADLEKIGSPVTRGDLKSYHASIADPLSVRLNAGTVYNTPPPTQGLASLIILALYDRLNVREAEGFEFAHGLVEATKRAFRVRDRVVTDPARVPQPPAQFLEDKFLDGEVLKIDHRRAARWPARPGEGDTIWMGAADSSGLAVSYIQSLYWEFGSGCVLPKTGRADAEPRLVVLARSEGAECAGARAIAVPHAQSGARRAQRRPRHGLWHHGRRRPAAVAGDDLRAARAARPAARQSDRCATLAAGPHLGLDAYQPADGVALRRPSGRAVDVRRP